MALSDWSRNAFGSSTRECAGMRAQTLSVTQSNLGKKGLISSVQGWSSLGEVVMCAKDLRGKCG